MVNSQHRAKYWTEFVASRPEFKPGGVLLEHFAAGTITRLCDCGCNSYDIAVPEGVAITPLAPPHALGGTAFRMLFETQPDRKQVEFRVSVDHRGNLSGLDVEFSGNHEPVPVDLELAAQPLYTSGHLAHVA